jgi:branched-chain amino acid transport system substrate-binding protein
MSMLAVIGTLAALTGCGSSSDDSSTASTGSSTAASSGNIPDGPITIGAPLALTGDLSFVDSGMKEGIDLAIADINAKGGVEGHMLELVTADTKSDPPTIGTAAQEVIDKGADFMIPTFDYDFGGPAARLAMSNNMVAVSGAGDPRYGREGIGQYMFNVYPGSPTEGAVAAEFATDQGFKNVYVLTDETFNHAKTVCSAFKERLGELGGTVTGDDMFKGTDRSIASQVTRMRGKAQGTDAVMLCSVGSGGTNALRQIRGAGIDVPVILDNAYDGSYWFDAAPKGGELFVVSAGAVTPGVTENPLQKHILEAVEKSTGKPVTFGVGTFAGYSSVQALADAIEQAKSTDPDAVKEALETFKDKELAIGKVTWDEKCHVPLGAEMQVLKVDVSQKKQEFVAAIKPEKTPPSSC